MQDTLATLKLADWLDHKLQSLWSEVPERCKICSPYLTHRFPRENDYLQFSHSWFFFSFYVAHVNKRKEKQSPQLSAVHFELNCSFVTVASLSLSLLWVLSILPLGGYWMFFLLLIVSQVCCTTESQTFKPKWNWWWTKKCWPHRSVSIITVKLLSCKSTAVIAEILCKCHRLPTYKHGRHADTTEQLV